MTGYQRLLFASCLALASSGAVAATTGPAACDTAAHRQLDFWVGRWDVYTANGNKLVAHSLVEKLYGGCTVRENWMPLSSPGGGSLNSYRPEDGSWRQYWVDSQNNVNEYLGKADSEGMRWTGTGVDRSGAVRDIRMSLRRLPDAVRQTCETSNDKGKTWQVDCDLIYKPSRNDGSMAAAN